MTLNRKQKVVLVLGFGTVERGIGMKMLALFLSLVILTTALGCANTPENRARWDRFLAGMQRAGDRAHAENMAYYQEQRRWANDFNTRQMERRQDRQDRAFGPPQRVRIVP